MKTCSRCRRTSRIIEEILQTIEKHFHLIFYEDNPGVQDVIDGIGYFYSKARRFVAGKALPNWKTRVSFRDLLEQYNTGAEDECKEIKRVLPIWVKRFNSIPSLKHFVSSLKKVKTESRFNRWLYNVYDYCDANKIWVEL